MTVTGISGLPSGDCAYAGSEVTVTAILSESLPDNCTITWGGDATFDNINGLTADATLSTGSNKKITASTSCQATPFESATFDAYSINQFNIEAGRSPKCLNEDISTDDFVIITNPAGHEDQVEVTGLTTATTGDHIAEATLCGGPTPPLEATYSVVGTGTWINVPPSTSIPPDRPTSSVSASTTEVKCEDSWGDDDCYKCKTTLAGGDVWDGIGDAERPPGESFTTQKSTKWGLDASVAGRFIATVPLFGGFELTVTVSGSWETTTTHEMISPGGEAPFLWHFYHYQMCTGISKTNQAWYMVGDHENPPSEYDPGWTPTTVEGWSGEFSVGLHGKNSYVGRKQKRCE